MSARRSRTGAKDDSIHAWMQHGEFERVTQYVKRGRAYASLDAADLIESWKTAFSAHCSDPSDLEKFQRYIDLSGEASLQKIALPLEEMKADMQRLTDYISARERELKKDPLAWKQANESMAHDIATFLVQHRKNKKTPH